MQLHVLSREVPESTLPTGFEARHFEVATISLGDDQVNVKKLKQARKNLETTGVADESGIITLGRIFGFSL